MRWHSSSISISRRSTSLSPLDHVGAQLIVAVEQGLGRLGDHPFHHAAHLQQHLAYAIEILVQSSFHEECFLSPEDLNSSRASGL